MDNSPGVITDFLAAAELVHRLGGEPYAMPITGPGGEIEAGTLGDLPVWWIPDAATRVATVARQMARRGQVGVVVAADPRRARWIVVATLTPVHPATVAFTEMNGLVCRRVRRALQSLHGVPLERLITLASALDVDAAGRQTFRLLRQLLDGAVTLLPAGVPRADRHAWTLTQITRLLFLRFVESEGWLDGNPRFLASAFDHCLATRRDPTRHLLQPLFFGTINRRWSDRSRLARSFGAIPFLNGGLFEPHALERQYAMRLPVAFWQEAFAAIVDRVDVTLDIENDDGRVNPELLGRVFEGVMHPSERKDQGAFFTPPALVDAVVCAALSCHLAQRLGRSEASIEQGLNDPDPQLQAALTDVTVLDPAVGSGAFLVGALHRLHGPGERDPVRVRRLVTRRLHGVDRHPGAVRLTELRLWLEVLRAMRGREPAAIPPLPNLDATIRAGDALIDPLHGRVLDVAATSQIALCQRAIRAGHGQEKRRALSAGRRTERRAMLASMREQDAAIGYQIADLMTSGRGITLFGEQSRLGRDARKRLEELRRERRTLRNEARRVARDASAAPFALSAAFAPLLLKRGGFDLVIGNPPWVRAERLPVQTRAALHDRYRWWRSGSGNGWGHLPDLAVAFIERGVGLLAPGGTLALLVPAKITTAGYAQVCRAELARTTTLHRVADLADDARADFDATTYPLAIITSRRSPVADNRIGLQLGASGASILQAGWIGQPNWMTAQPEAQRLLQMLARTHAPLSDSVRLQLGVKTGANGIFLNPPAELSEWCRPALRGRDLRAFCATPLAQLLWPADARGTPWRDLPTLVREYIDRSSNQLLRRADQVKGPAWQLFRTTAATAPHRVVWRDLARDLEAAYLNDSAVVPLNSCYVAALPTLQEALALTAWLNSAPIRALARLAAEPAAGGCARYAARAVGSIPLPSGALADSTLAAFGRAGEATPALDDYAASLLRLTPDEARLLGDLATHRR